jgi:predicted nucleic acid-binding Zn ribbon protein
VTDHDPIPLSTSLDAVMRSLRGPDRRQIGGLFGRWDEVVGEQVAAHVRPVKLDQGVLVVEVDEPAWATQVTLMSGRLRERLAESVGVDVERLEVRVAGARGPAHDQRGARRGAAGERPRDVR